MHLEDKITDIYDSLSQAIADRMHQKSSYSEVGNTLKFLREWFKNY